jgi:hypothetical protein
MYTFVYKKQQLFTLRDHLASPCFLVGSLLLIFLDFCVVLSYVFMLWVLCCLILCLYVMSSVLSYLMSLCYEFCVVLSYVFMLWVLCCDVLCLYVMSSVLWCLMSLCYEFCVVMSYVCLRIVVSNTHSDVQHIVCCAFVLFFFVPHVASFSGLSIFYCPFGIL